MRMIIARELIGGEYTTLRSDRMAVAVQVPRCHDHSAA